MKYCSVHEYTNIKNAESAEFTNSVKAAILFQFDRAKKKLAIFVENWLWRPSCFSEIAEN